MRSLKSELQRHSLVVLVAAPRFLHRVYSLLKSLNLNLEVRMKGPGEEVPQALLYSRFAEILLAVWLSELLTGGGHIRIGVDPGVHNVGLAILVGELIAYTGLLRSMNDVVELVGELQGLRLYEELEVKVGYSKSSARSVRELIRKLEERGVSVKSIAEGEARRRVILGDFTALYRKVTTHELDALRIALYPDSKRYTGLPS